MIDAGGAPIDKLLESGEIFAEASLNPEPLSTTNDSALSKVGYITKRQLLVGTVENGGDTVAIFPEPV